MAEHFNLPGHNQVYDNNQVQLGTETRQREEQRLMFQLGTLAPATVIRVMPGSLYLGGETSGSEQKCVMQ